MQKPTKHSIIVLSYCSFFNISISAQLQYSCLKPNYQLLLCPLQPCCDIVASTHLHFQLSKLRYPTNRTLDKYQSDMITPYLGWSWLSQLKSLHIWVDAGFHNYKVIGSLCVTLVSFNEKIQLFIYMKHIHCEIWAK